MPLPEYCARHDIHYPYGAQCPECRADEASEHRRRMLEQQEEARRDAEQQHREAVERERNRQHDEELRHKELVRLREQEIYRRQNPGDYECPHCKYISVKSGASRCPLCQGEVGSEYWAAVRVREKAEAERKLAEAQAASERQRVAAQAAVERKKALDEAAAAEYLRTAPERAAAAERAALAAARAAAEAQRRRRNAASWKSASDYGQIGATLGGIVLGFSGCVSCFNSFGATGFNLFNGLAYGVICGAVIGVIVGIVNGQSKD